MSASFSVESSILMELTLIPGVGNSIATDLFHLGIRKVSDLKGKDPETLYSRLNQQVGQRQDRCLLYVFRCAVYFAETPHPDKKKLQWWKWKDQK